MISATSDSSSGRSRLRWRVCKWLIMSMVLIVAAGALFQFSMTLWESHRYPLLANSWISVGCGFTLTVRARGVQPSGVEEIMLCPRIQQQPALWKL
jgi:hypothetical protein